MAYKIGDECVACGMCAENCPVSCITYNKEKGRYQIDESLCISCGTCASVCPVGAPKEN